MTTTAIHTPLDFAEPTKVGRRRFWKRILPVKEINYKGRKINFDKQYHMDLAEAFRNGAFEQVPLVFADSENRHNMDPRNFGGEIIDLQARQDGTWAFIEADRDAAKVIRKNPKLGVSARILEGVAKSDGRSFKRAVNHVLLTMNPRVSGLGPWQAVDLSDEDADIEVVDLTAETYEEGNPMGTKIGTKPKATGDEREIDLSSLSDEQFQQMLDLADTLLADPETDEDADEDDGIEEVEETPKSKVRRKKSKTKITVEKDSEDEGDPEDDEDEDGDESTDLSERAVDNDTRNTVRQMQIDLAEQRWETERGEFERAGVPPFLLDLAEPVLSQPEALTIDLSDDESIDATDTIRKMLNGVKGVLDFSDEIGTAIDLSDVSKEGEDPASKLLAAWDEQYG